MSEFEKIKPKFDDAVAAGLRRQLAELKGDCPDSAALAAWFENQLGRDEREVLQAHFSSCRLCQQKLALLARMESADPAGVSSARKSKSSRKSKSWGWRLAVPAGALAALAALGLLFLRLQQNSSLDSSGENGAPIEMAQAERPAAPQLAPGSAAEEAANAPAPAAPDQAAHRAQASPVAQIPQRTFEAKSGMPAAVSNRPVEPAVRRAPKNRIATAVQQPDTKSPGEESPPPADLSAAPMAALAPRAPQSFSASVGAAPAAGAASAARGLARTQAVRPLIVNSPDLMVTWTATNPGAIVETHRDSGQAIVRAVGTQARLLAGVATSRQMCWMVGEGGTVLHTSDGNRWQQVKAPTAADLIAISAEGPSKAIVTAADGRKFSTTDGGQSWQPAS